MGKELPLARSEEEGQSVLLAITSSGELITTSTRGNKRTQEYASFRDSKGRKTEGTKAESKGSRKVERANARSSKPARRRRDNKDRKSDRGDEGEHKPAGRSSEVMGVVR